MIEFKNKNDYSVIVFDEKKMLIKYTYVHSPYLLSQYLDKNFSNWQRINVYVRRSGRFLGQYRKGGFIPHKPK